MFANIAIIWLLLFPDEEGAYMNWCWLLIIFLLGATGKKMYDEYKKRKEAEEAAKIRVDK